MEKRIFTSQIIAPCGINCGICKAYLRPKNPCHGCTCIEQNTPKTHLNCRIRLCDKRDGQFCFTCAVYPCDRLKQLDKRYRIKYGMSEIENLNFIRDKGLNAFIENENGRWISEKGILYIHDRKFYKFG